jgi:hypothetical protein
VPQGKKPQVERYLLLATLSSAFILVIQSAMLWLQAKALRRHGHRSFRYLAAGSIFSLIYCAASIPLYIIPLSPSVYWTLAIGSILMVFPSGVLGLVGSVLLLRSYAKLANLAGADSVVGT